jgi:peptidyl-prolyl cis-trans isomerase SurA
MSVRTTGLMAALLLVIAAGCKSNTQTGVVAIVNGYKITYTELEQYYQSQVERAQAPASDDEQKMLRLNLLREVIDRQIMLQRAEKLGLMAVDSEVEARLKEYRAPYDNDAAFEANLKGRGMTLEDLKIELRRTLTIEKLFNKEVTSHITVPDTELKAFYEENKASFNLPEQQVHLAQILVTAKPEAPVPNLRNDDARDAETAQAKIEMIAQRLQNGADFAETAQNLSEDPVSTASGGDLGFIPQSSLERADVTLRRVVASLSPGEVSPVIRTGEEFRIIRLISVEPAGQRDYSDPRVQQTLRETLMNRKDQLLKAAYLETARNESKVSNYLAEEVVRNFGVTD